MARGAHSFAAAGDMRAPPFREIVQWILEAWDSLIIIRSFRNCAITVATDGSEDVQIHCRKEGQPCHAGLDRFTSIQQAVSASHATNPFDNFTSSDIKDAFPENSLIDLSDNEIEID